MSSIETDLRNLVTSSSSSELSIRKVDLVQLFRELDAERSSKVVNVPKVAPVVVPPTTPVTTVK